MYLIEAVVEKDYILDNINLLVKHITNILSTNDEKELKFLEKALNEKFKELDELYKNYQRFSTLVEKAKASAFIQLEDTSLSLADAIAIRDSLIHKLESLTYIYEKAIESTETFNIIDIDALMNDIKDLKIDIKTLNYKIDYTYWSTKLSMKDA